MDISSPPMDLDGHPENQDNVSPKQRSMDEMQGSNKNKSSFAKAFKDYVQSSTCHGICHVFGEDIHPIRRIFWATVMAVSLVCYGFLAASAYERFYSNETSTSISYEEVKQTFPAMTLCHSSQIRTSYINEQFDKGVYIPLYDDEHIEHIRKVRFNILFRGLGYTDGNNSNLLTKGAFSYLVQETDVLANTSQHNGTYAEYINGTESPSEDTITLGDNNVFSRINVPKLCKYVSKEKKNCNNLEPFNFGLDGLHLIQGGNSLENKYFYENQHNKTRCASFRLSGDSVYCKITIHLDPMFGRCDKIVFYDEHNDLIKSDNNDRIYMTVFAEDEYFNQSHRSEWSMYPKPAWFVKFHDSNEFVTMETTDVVGPLMPGIHLISVAKTETHSLPPPYNTCIDTKQKGFKNPLQYYNYTHAACVSECESLAYLKTGNCIKLPFPGDKLNVPLCYLKYVPNINCSHCLPSCTTTKYETKSKAVYGYDTTNSTHSPSVLDISLDIEHSKVVEQAAYPAASFLGDIGGQLGLLVGASVLTIVELIDLVMVAATLSRAGRAHVPADMV